MGRSAKQKLRQHSRETPSHPYTQLFIILGILVACEFKSPVLFFNGDSHS